MRISILTFLLIATVAVASAQRYALHGATKGVTVLSGGKTVAAKSGMELKATDQIVIPAGGVAEIHNKLDNCIYRSVRAGKIAVTHLMLEARQAAGDHVKAIGGKVTVVREGDDAPDRVYGEKGMVVRGINTSNESEGVCGIAEPDTIFPRIVNENDSIQHKY